MINVSPVGRNASNQERNDYEKYDKEHNIRVKFVETLKEKFPEFGLTYVSHVSLPTLILNVLSHVQLQHWRPNLVRRLPHRLGQDVLPEAHRERERDQRRGLLNHPFLWGQDVQGWE